MRNRRYRDHSDFMLTNGMKFQLNAAFSAMRKAGLVAKQNFSCCGGCAGSELSTIVAQRVLKNPKQRDKIKGVVAYHRQDTERLNDTGKFYLLFGQVDSEKAGTVGLPTVEVGRLVVKVLGEMFIPYEWDGTPEQRICVRMDLYQIQSLYQIQTRKIHAQPTPLETAIVPDVLKEGLPRC